MMRTILNTTFALLLAGGLQTMAVEEAKYEVTRKDGDFEIRKYEPHVLAETIVEGGLEDVGNKAFNLLFEYISGNNKSKEKVAMTAPVSQEAAGEKIAMTAPVSQEAAGKNWAVSFMMPADLTMETTPEPVNPKVKIRQVPARHMAAIRYSGTWSKKGYEKHKALLEAWIKEKNLETTGEAVWARYNPPFTLWFMRRNEVLIPIKAPAPL